MGRACRWTAAGACRQIRQKAPNEPIDFGRDVVPAPVTFDVLRVAEGVGGGARRWRPTRSHGVNG